MHPNVVVVDLSESDVSDVGIAALAICRRLQKIDLNALKGTRSNITYQGLYVFVNVSVCPCIHVCVCVCACFACMRVCTCMCTLEHVCMCVRE